MSNVGFGNRTRTFGSKIKLNAKVPPVFVKLDKDFKPTSEETDNVTFFITGFKTDEFTNKEGEQGHSITISGDMGEGGAMQIQIGLNQVAKVIINTLSSVKDLAGKEIFLRVYTKKREEKRDLSAVYIEIDGEKGEWKYAPSEFAEWDNKKWVGAANHHIAPQFKDYNHTYIEGEKTPTVDPIPSFEGDGVITGGEDDDDLPF